MKQKQSHTQTDQLDDILKHINKTKQHMPMQLQTAITFIVHSIVSKQIKATKEGQWIIASTAVKSQIMITDKKL